MATDDPTPRELLIQLQAAVAQIGTLAAQVNKLAETLERTYVPRGEYLEARKGDSVRFKHIEDDLDDQSGFRRQVAAGFAVGFLLIIAGAVLALARVPGVGS